MRYVFDRPGEDYKRLGEIIVDHYGSFLDHKWDMDDVNKFHQVVRNCGLSVDEFISTDWSDQCKKAVTKTKATKKPKAVKKTK